MKKVLLILAFTFATSAVFTSCRDEKSDDLEDSIEEVGDDMEDAVDDID
jgi:hypothetical protein